MDVIALQLRRNSDDGIPECTNVSRFHADQVAAFQKQRRISGGATVDRGIP